MESAVSWTKTVLTPYQRHIFNNLEYPYVKRATKTKTTIHKQIDESFHRTTSTSLSKTETKKYTHIHWLYWSLKVLIPLYKDTQTEKHQNNIINT